MAPARNVTLCYEQKARHRFCDSYIFSDRNLSKWPLGGRFIQPLWQGMGFPVFSPKKRLHISSVQDKMINVRVGFLALQKTAVNHVASL